MKRYENGTRKRRGLNPARHLLALLLLFVLAFPVRGAAEDGVSPVWKKGDAWLVRAVYRSHLDEDKWSEPVFWEYEIVGFEGDGSDALYILEIQDRAGRLKLTSRLVYRAEDLSLVRVEITKRPRGGEFVKVLMTYSGGTPVVTEQTLTPYDTPVFPLACPSSIDFAVTKQIDRLKAVQTVRQEVRQVSGADELPDQPPGRDLIEVRCSGKDGLIFAQYWDSAFPWPLYGQNMNMKYWLVRE